MVRYYLMAGDPCVWEIRNKKSQGRANNTSCLQSAVPNSTVNVAEYLCALPQADDGLHLSISQRPSNQGFHLAYARPILPA